MGNKIDAVLPLTVRDYARSEVLRETLRRFFVDLGTCWVVTPDEDLEPIRMRIKDRQYRVIPESSVVPELAFYNRLRRRIGRSRAPLSGWFVQQLVKMAIAEFVDTEWYMTLDADVICLKRVAFSDLITEGRAITDRYRHEIHREWYQWSERVLGLPRSGWVHAVTPSLFHRGAMRQLHSYLAGRVNVTLRFFALLLPRRSLARAILASWRSYLLRNLPWTEYSLYNTFLEAMNLYDTYYIAGGGSMVYGKAVWQPDQFASWDPEEGPDDYPNFFFTVFQSAAKISVDEVRDKVRRFLERP